MTSTLDIFWIIKNNKLEWNAIGLYNFLASSNLFSVISATSYLSLISYDNDYDYLSTSIAFSSSSILPWDVLKTSRILFSISLSVFLFSYEATINFYLSSSKEAFSF